MAPTSPRSLLLAAAAAATALLLLLPAASAFVPSSVGAHASRRRVVGGGRLHRPTTPTNPTTAAAASSPSPHHEKEEPAAPPPSAAPAGPTRPRESSPSRRQLLAGAGGALAASSLLLLLGGGVGGGGGGWLAASPARAAVQGLEALEPQGYVDQLRQAMPVKTIRGIWRIREYRDGSTLCKGRLKMKGFVEEPNKGTLEYTGCNDGKGRGNWLLKPARIENGQIRFSARWKVRFSDGDSLIYRGDVLAGGGYSKATAQITKGEILKPIKGVTGNLTERKIGTFEADLIEPSDDEEKL